MRVFVDTNVMVSSFGFRGIARKLLAHLVERHEVIVSPQVIEEFKRVVIAKINANVALVESFIEEFIQGVEVVQPPFPDRFPVRDSTDIEILGAALKTNADVLLTGDRDLLEVENPPLPILSPRELHDKLFGAEAN